MSNLLLKKNKSDESEVAFQHEPDAERKNHPQNHTNASVDTTLPMIFPPSTTNLLDINDDCLYELFNLKRVSVMDLCSLARTCTKLKQIATDVFKRSYKVCDIRRMELYYTRDVLRVLKIFGSSILDLRIDYNAYATKALKVVDSISRNCTELKSLTVASFTIPDCSNAFSKLRLLFSKLKFLYIFDVLIDGCSDWHNDSIYSRSITVTPNGNVVNIFRDCHWLIELRVVSCFALETAVFDSTFPQLKCIIYEDLPNVCLYDVRSFIYRHHILKTLVLRGLVPIQGTLEMISANCTDLRKLEFATNAKAWPQEKYEPSLQQLGKLKHLTELKIDWSKKNMVGVLGKLSRSRSLKVLYLKATLGSVELLPTISRINSLRVLKLVDINDLLPYHHDLRNLTQLVELFFDNVHYQQEDYDNVHCQQMYSEIVDIIRHLVNLKKFKFHVTVNRPRRQYLRISREVYMQMVKVVEERPGDKKYLQLDCYTTGNFDDLRRPSVEFKRLSSSKINWDHLSHSTSNLISLK